MAKMNVATDRMIVERLADRVFALSEDIRSVAAYYHGRLATVSRPIPGGSCWWDSDKYEELIVNPTLITLLRQRGNIDCGGIQHIVIHYGNVTQIVYPIDGGHVTVGFEPGREWSRFIPGMKKLLKGMNLTVEQKKNQFTQEEPNGKN